MNIWQTGKMLANTHNIITKWKNNIVIPLSSCFPKEGKNTIHSLLIVTVKLVTMNEDKRCPFGLKLRWGFSRLHILSFHQSVVVYSFQEEIYIYKSYTWDVYLHKTNQPTNNKHLMMTIMLQLSIKLIICWKGKCFQFKYIYFFNI